MGMEWPLLIMHVRVIPQMRLKLPYYYSTSPPPQSTTILDYHGHPPLPSVYFTQYASQKDHDGMLPLHRLVARPNHIHVHHLQFLIKAYPEDVSTTPDNYDMLPFHHACFKQNLFCRNLTFIVAAISWVPDCDERYRCPFAKILTNLQFFHNFFFPFQFTNYDGIKLCFLENAYILSLTFNFSMFYFINKITLFLFCGRI